MTIACVTRAKWVHTTGKQMQETGTCIGGRPCSRVATNIREWRSSDLTLGNLGFILSALKNTLYLGSPRILSSCKQAQQAQ